MNDIDAQPPTEPTDVGEVADDGERVGRRVVVGSLIGAVALGAAGLGAAKVLDNGTDQREVLPPRASEPTPIVLTAPPSTTTVEARRALGVDPATGLSRLHDLRAAVEVVDDFTFASPGQVPGWQIVDEAPGSGTVWSPSEGGLLQLSSGPTSTGRAGLHRGLAHLRGMPRSTMEWRLRLLARAGRTGGAAFGYLDGVAGGGTLPSVGGCFVLRPDVSDHWLLVCANSEGRIVQESDVVPDDAHHRFTITTDGVGLVRFYVDDVRVGSIDSNVPITSDAYGVGIEVFGGVGEGSCIAEIDWFYLRRELAR